ncbi:ParB/RepB/Spo0J family partition protein [Ruminococcus difficilis]|uniref:ParB/RepB/Spo0J family partition protein n=1 Tax=Ruminococcus difficilis TaxID=2763069 RepID=A0A934TZ43_9FIRM|nr:ParB/RepB/Spo0J family partition protein [Ruminococcus difficilis]MBK6088531.1 ParB/RepB/Spo0J family partition protein [Ruminococcus difficilis]MCI6823770.1 ParB/RepB/Spo0J family partition protein [Ruminococcus bromii]
MTNISINKLHEFKDHPYQVLDNDEMNSLIESVQQQGIMTPLIVRPLEDTTDEYEIISGHRRFRAAQKAGLLEVPAFIRPVSRDEAAIMVVDSNLHREHLLPSEKAFAYKLKAEALKHQGQRTDLTSEQLAPKLSTELIAEQEGTSKDTVKRYIRLTKLIPDILKMVDEQRIAFSVGVELSYLTECEQQDLLEAIELEDKTPSLSQAIQMKKLSQSGKLDSDTISKIISEEKPNQREKISFQYDVLSKYFPKNFTPQDIYKRLLKLAQDDYRRRQRNREER